MTQLPAGPGAQAEPGPITVLSHGGGQDSACLSALLLKDPAFRERYAPGELIAVMSDTGNEYPETVAYVQRAKQTFEASGVPFTLITPDLGHHKASWPSLTGNWERLGSIGSVAYRTTCSPNLKADPIYNFLEALVAGRFGYAAGRKRALKAYARDHGPLQVIIGFAAGEEKRIQPLPEGWMREVIERSFPLIDLGIDRARAQEITRQLGFEVPMPSNCMFCHYASPAELLRLWRLHPERYAEWEAAEARKLAQPRNQHGPNMAVFGKVTLPERLAQAQVSHGHLSDAELDELRFSRGHHVRSRG